MSFIDEGSVNARLQNKLGIDEDKAQQLIDMGKARLQLQLGFPVNELGGELTEKVKASQKGTAWLTLLPDELQGVYNLINEQQLSKDNVQFLEVRRSHRLLVELKAGGIYEVTYSVWNAELLKELIEQGLFDLGMARANEIEIAASSDIKQENIGDYSYQLADGGFIQQAEQKVIANLMKWTGAIRVGMV